MLDRADRVPDDPRYAPMVAAMRSEGRGALRRFIQQVRPLAVVGDGNERVCVMPEHIFIFTKHGWEPVSAHRFVDRPVHLGISQAEHTALSKEERACRGARKALLEDFDGYAGRWLEAYWPEIADELWWDGGVSKIQARSIEKANAVYAAKAEEVRARTRS